jgi:hypothetical protein
MSNAGSNNNSNNDNTTNQNNEQQNWAFNLMSNMFVMVGLAVFAFVVKHVLNSIN